MNKEFDCVEMKHRIQSEIYEETKDMTHEEELAYFSSENESSELREPDKKDNKNSHD